VEQLPEEPIIAIVDEQGTLKDSTLLKFPGDWTGKWKGNLKIYAAKGLEKIVPMELIIKPSENPSVHKWVIVYDSVPRHYELVLRDSSKGIYSIDEKNGIDIMSYVLGNHFVSRFTIMGSMLDCEYHLLNHDEMVFEIRSGKDEHNWTTGNVVMQSDSIPPVGVYNISTLQTASLYRVKE